MVDFGGQQAASPALTKFSSPRRYNSAFPEAVMPSNIRELDALRRFDAGDIGVEDDSSGTGALLTIDFLPGGAPLSDDLDRIGTVVASNWGRAPVYVLAADVSLRAAWLAVSRIWPTRLSEAAVSFADIRRYAGTS